jgi:hypothetical protein
MQRHLVGTTLVGTIIGAADLGQSTVVSPRPVPYTATPGRTHGPGTCAA